MKGSTLKTLLLSSLLSWEAQAFAQGKEGAKKEGKSKAPAGKYEALAAVGIPHPYELSLGTRLDEKSRASVHVGYFNRKFRGGKGFKSLDGSMKHVEARYLSFFQERPFWAVSVGVQELAIAGARDIAVATEVGDLKIASEASIVVRSLYWTPQIGLSHRGKSGLIYNFVTGIQIPFAASARFSAKFTDDAFIDESIKSTDDYQSLKRDIERLGEKYGKLALPVLKLFELGISF